MRVCGRTLPVRLYSCAAPRCDDRLCMFACVGIVTYPSPSSTRRSGVTSFINHRSARRNTCALIASLVLSRPYPSGPSALWHKSSEKPFFFFRVAVKSRTRVHVCLNFVQVQDCHPITRTPHGFDRRASIGRSCESRPELEIALQLTSTHDHQIARMRIFGKYKYIRVGSVIVDIVGSQLSCLRVFIKLSHYRDRCNNVSTIPIHRDTS
jgi:hypothetical protein